MKGNYSPFPNGRKSNILNQLFVAQHDELAHPKQLLKHGPINLSDTPVNVVKKL